MVRGVRTERVWRITKSLLANDQYLLIVFSVSVGYFRNGDLKIF